MLRIVASTNAAERSRHAKHWRRLQLRMQYPIGKHSNEMSQHAGAWERGNRACPCCAKQELRTRRTQAELGNEGRGNGGAPLTPDSSSPQFYPFRLSPVETEVRRSGNVPQNGWGGGIAGQGTFGPPVTRAPEENVGWPSTSSFPAA